MGQAVKAYIPFFPCFLFYSAVTDNLNAVVRPGETLQLNQLRPRGCSWQATTYISPHPYLKHHLDKTPLEFMLWHYQTRSKFLAPLKKHLVAS